jgi:hypothetical protein
MRPDRDKDPGYNTNIAGLGEVGPEGTARSRAFPSSLETNDDRHIEINAIDANAEGVKSSSPGLRGTSYPGYSVLKRVNPERIESTSAFTPTDATLSGLVRHGDNPG